MFKIAKEEAVAKVNKKFAEVFHKHDDDRISGRVCLLCDRMLCVNNVRWLKSERLKKMKALFKPVKQVKASVESAYKCVGAGA